MTKKMKGNMSPGEGLLMSLIAGPGNLPERLRLRNRFRVAHKGFIPATHQPFAKGSGKGTEKRF